MNNMFLMIGLGNRLRDALAAAGISHSNAARELGISYRTLNHYLNDMRVPKLEALSQISKITHMSLDELISGLSHTSISTLSLQVSLELIERRLKKARAKLPPKKKAKLVILIAQMLDDQNSENTSERIDNIIILAS